jgi:hypothetical protein
VDIVGVAVGDSDGDAVAASDGDEEVVEEFVL